MQRPAIWPTHRLLPLCVLYLNKLVTGLKNIYDKWCEERLDGCLSAPICPVHFLSTAIPWRFYSEEKAKENKSCFLLVFQQTDGLGPGRRLDQTRQGQLHEAQQKKRLDTDETHPATQTLLNLMQQGLVFMRVGSVQHLLKVNFGSTIGKTSSGLGG